MSFQFIFYPETLFRWNLEPYVYTGTEGSGDVAQQLTTIYDAQDSVFNL